MVGRIIWGYGVGVLSVNIGRYIEETVPEFLLGYFGPIFPWAQTVGSFWVLLMAAGLPDDKDPKLGDTNFWRVIFGIPMIVSLLSMIGLQFYVRYDSPKYLINTRKYARAHKMIDKIYHFEEDKE